MAKKTYRQAINEALRQEMERDPRVVIMGEDIAGGLGAPGEQDAWGGPLGVTKGLMPKFGRDRVLDTPISESAFIGAAVGAAATGLRPVAELMFVDFFGVCFDQIYTQAAKFKYMFGGKAVTPLVIRTMYGAGFRAASQHSQCLYPIFTHIPGLRVVMPSNASDACGLLRTAIRCDDPVLFLEHKKLYREPYNRAPHPGSNYTIPFGKAKIVKPGRDLTIVTYGALVQKSLQAATQLERKNPDWSIEIIDLRSLAPYDWEAVKQSVEKTSRVLMAHEDVRSFGFGAELAARVADELFSYLDAPVGRVAALDTWVAYQPEVEDEILPQTENIERESERLLRY